MKSQHRRQRATSMATRLCSAGETRMAWSIISYLEPNETIAGDRQTTISRFGREFAAENASSSLRC